MRRSLDELDQQLSQVRREVSKATGGQAEVLTRQAAIEQALKRNQDQIENLAKLDDAFRSEQDNQIDWRNSRRITYFLETLPAQRQLSPPARAGSSAQTCRSAREAGRSENTADRLTSILNLVGDFMTRDSEKLDLEHSGSRLRLDVRQLAVVADTPEGPVPLYRMEAARTGSAITSRSSRVASVVSAEGPTGTRFSVLRSASQAHYPAEQDRTATLTYCPTRTVRQCTSCSSLYRMSGESAIT